MPNGRCIKLGIFRFAISCLLAAIGLAAIYFGYRLFADGAGIAKGVKRFDLKTEKFKVSFAGMSVGGILMRTSAVWCYFAYGSVPRLEAHFRRRV